MNFMLAQLSRVTKNPHTSGAAAVVALGQLASRLTAIWWPEHQVQVDATVKEIQKAAIAYGLLMAGDSGAPPPPGSYTAEKIEQSSKNPSTS